MHGYGEEITLTRDVEAVQIPYGQKVPLNTGHRLFVHQVLGGNFTVITESGIMVRIDAKDADALGEFGTKMAAEAQKHLAPLIHDRSAGTDTSLHAPLGHELTGLASQSIPEIPAGTPPAQAEIIKTVWELLRTVYDPEIPVNIVELGLIYEMKVEALPNEGYGVDIKMSLTAPGCGMGPILQQDVQMKVVGIDGVKSTHVEVVFDPPWDPSRMTEAARLQLGML